MRETATIFFCDISGTIQGRGKNEEKDYEMFNNLILKIKEQNKSDHLFFSLVSSDDLESVQCQIEYLSKFFSKSISIQKQFFDQGYFEGNQVVTRIFGKCDQMIYYLNKISSRYSIDKIIFADDLEFFHEMFIEISENFSWKNKIISIIPTNKQGLGELNSLLVEKLADERIYVLN